MASVITGGSSGIALDTAKLLAKEGKVYILDIHEPQETNENFEFIKCDVSKSSEVNKAFELITKKDTIKKAFFSAGYFMLGKVTDITDEELDNIINVNVKGIVYAMRAVLPHMIENDFGRIVIMGSNHSIIGSKNCSIYSLTKAAVANLTKTAAADFAEYDIRINAICPGSIKTPLMDKLVADRARENKTTPEVELQKVINSSPIKRIGTPEEVAKVVYLMLSKDINFMSGSLVSIDGGTTAA